MNWRATLAPWGARVAQWWEHSPPTNVAQIPASTPYVGWVCCWFSPLLREVFLRVLRFSPLFKNQHFQIPIRPGIRWTKNHYVDVLPANRYFLFILFIYLCPNSTAKLSRSWEHVLVGNFCAYKGFINGRQSDFGWSTVNGYLSGELASSFEEERKTDVWWWAERRAETKSKAGVAVFVPWIERSRLLPLLLSFQFGPSASAQPNRWVLTLRIV